MCCGVTSMRALPISPCWIIALGCDQNDALEGFVPLAGAPFDKVADACGGTDPSLGEPA